MRRRLLAGALASVAVVLGTAAPAFADRLVIRKVDTTAFPTVQVTARVEGATPAPGSWNVRENELLVKDLDVAPLSKTTGLAVALVVDTSAAMGEKNRMDAVKTALHQWVAGKSANEQVAVIAAGPQPRLFQDFTGDARLIDAAIDKLTPQGQPALWDGIRRTVALFEGAPNLQHDVVVVAAGEDDKVSKATAEQARAGVLDARGSLFAVGFKGAGVDEAALAGMASATGGSYTSADGTGAMTSGLSAFERSLRDNQYTVAYSSTAKSAITVGLTAGSLKAEAQSVNVGTVAQGATKPETVTPSGVSLFRGTTGKYVAVLLVLVAAGLIAFAIASLVVGENAGLDSRLQIYSDPTAASDEESGSSFAQTAFVQRAVEMTGNIADQRGLLDKLSTKLEQADLPLRPAEALFFYGAGALIVTLLSFVVLGFFGGVVLFVLGLFLPFGILNYLAARRKKRFTTQLPDMLQLLAGSLRAGYSLLQGVEAVAQEVNNPMAYELNRVLSEARLGRPLEDALEESAARLGSPDFEWAVMAIRIQREVGGNLAELLQTVAETMVHRERLRREVRALTAEGRMSAIVLGCLPVGLGVMMYAINPDYMRVLFTDSFGKVMLGAGTGLALFGFWWMKKTIDIEI